jgi:AcrR family transcriptional regulator
VANGARPGPATGDRRVRRTRELLRAALLALIAEQGYDRTTVQDILDRADVGRSTFYDHYRDKDDLLLSGFGEVHAVLAAEINKSAGASSEFLQPLLIVFEHVDGYRYLWKSLVRGGAAELAQRALRDSTADLLRVHLRAQFPGERPDERRFEAAIQFAVGALTGMLSWWLSHDVGYSAQEMHAIFRRLAADGLRSSAWSAEQCGREER